MSTDSAQKKPANPFQLNELFTRLPGKWLRRMVQSWSESVLGMREIAQCYTNMPTSNSPREFILACFKVLNIDYLVESGDPGNIPSSGPTVVVANHPFGGVEGMLLIEMLTQDRDDVRVMANGLLKRIPEVKDMFISVNPYASEAATRSNIPAMREASRWLKQGGLLVVFPAGDVASLRWSKLALREGEWDSSIARLTRLCDATVVPVHFCGRNSALFCAAGLLHPMFKTMLLPRELLNKRNTTLSLRIGKPLDKKRLLSFENMQDMADYMRLRTSLLGREEPTQPEADKPVSAVNKQMPVAEPLAVNSLRADIATLPAEQCLAGAGDLHVWYASAGQIPNVLQEIGRQREITFRAVGEGSGKARDLDLYDQFYLHLFVWDNEQARIVGGYRLGRVDEILRKYGRRGLYSYSLFRYSRSLLQQLGPAIELGRSFVRPEFQRNFTPLMLLWKGIGTYVARNPQYANLFGPVSISNDYTNLSQLILIRFLKQNLFDSDLARRVKPRSPYRLHQQQDLSANCQSMTIEELSALIADIEEDDKGVPVLIRQYLKMGGKLLGFNVDPDFGDCVDGLIRVDLRQAEPRVLRKYLGHEGAQQFLDWHQEEKQVG